MTKKRRKGANLLEDSARVGCDRQEPNVRRIGD